MALIGIRPARPAATRRQDATRGDETYVWNLQRQPTPATTGAGKDQAGWRRGGARGPRGTERTGNRAGRLDRRRLAGTPPATVREAPSRPSSSGSSRPPGSGRSADGRSAAARSGRTAAPRPSIDRLAVSWAAGVPGPEAPRTPTQSDPSRTARTTSAVVACACRCTRMVARRYWISWTPPRHFTHTIGLACAAGQWWDVGPGASEAALPNTALETPAPRLPMISSSAAQPLAAQPWLVSPDDQLALALQFGARSP
jgi:hypothetical protein